MIGDDKLANLKIQAASNNEAVKNLDPHSSLFFILDCKGITVSISMVSFEFSGLMINIWRKTYKINNFKKREDEVLLCTPTPPQITEIYLQFYMSVINVEKCK